MMKDGFERWLPEEPDEKSTPLFGLDREGPDLHPFVYGKDPFLKRLVRAIRRAINEFREEML